MGVLWGLIAVLLAFVVLASVYDVVRRHLGAGRTAGWILLIVLLPFAGSLLYWGLRRPAQDEVQRSLDADSDMRHGPPPPPGARIGH
jgi:hypothetical protein